MDDSVGYALWQDNANTTATSNTRSTSEVAAVPLPVRIAWVVSLAGTAGLSALVWGPPFPLVALAFVVVALLLAWAILWALGQGVPVQAARAAGGREAHAAD